MKNSKLVIVLAVLAVLAAPGAYAAVTNTSTPNAAIAPDNGRLDDTNGTGGGGITDAISFTETGTISDVNVGASMTHTWRADIQAVITYSGGGAVVLANNHVTSGDNYNATFDSEAGIACTNATQCGLTTGSPCETAPGPTCQPNQSLTAFNGLTSPGTWTLAVCDRTAADTGTLVSWSVTVDGDGQLPVDLQGFSVN